MANQSTLEAWVKDEDHCSQTASSAQELSIRRLDAALWDRQGDQLTVEESDILRVYLLTPQSNRRYCPNLFRREPEKVKEAAKGQRKGGARCTLGKCKDNPNCLNHLGQEYWLEQGWDFQRATFTVLVVPNPSDIIGGMQVWFHNPTFRAGVFAYQRSGGMHDSVCYQLQLAFANMQLGKRATYDPSPFVESLQLAKGEQQDAQEFCKLFTSMMENDFATQPNLQLRNLISDQVLNLQLMRFVFDMQNSSKKKVKSVVHFPAVLDMKDFMQSANVVEADDWKYDLRAVLMHRGTTADSGHYVARVYDETRLAWFILDDDTVTTMTDIQFDFEDEVRKRAKSKKDAATPPVEGTYSSRSAYMLAYVKRSYAKTPVPTPPEDVLQEVDKSSSEYEAQLAAFHERYLVQQPEVLLWDPVPLENLFAYSQEFSYYVDTTSLQIWLQADLVEQKKPSETTKQDTSSAKLEPGENPMQFSNHMVTCLHGKLNPTAVHRTKRVNKAAGELLQQKYSRPFIPTLTSDSFCRECVEKVFEGTPGRLQTEDHEQIVQTVKDCMKDPSETRYWLSKKWFSEWKKKKPKLGQANSIPSPSSEEYLKDLLCQHKRLSADESDRMLISEQAFVILQSKFCDMYALADDEPICPECSLRETQEWEAAQDLREQAAAHKAQLRRLLDNKRREAFTPGTQHYILSMETSFSLLENAPLLCEHASLLYDVSHELEGCGDDYVLLTEEEWNTLQGAWYTCDTPIRLTQANGEIVGSDPPMCQDCRHKRLLDWIQTAVVVTRVSHMNPSPNGKSKTDEDNSEDYEPKNSQSRIRSKREPEKNNTPRKRSILEPTVPVRSSKRLRANKTYRIAVTKDMRVRDLKSKITEHTGLLPYLQKLTVVRTNLELTENGFTMEELGIQVGERLTLEQHSVVDGQEDASCAGPEKGFTGTILHGVHPALNSRPQSDFGMYLEMFCLHSGESWTAGMV
ncbi:hypothetical protein HK104_005915 [Borealophlyctis nickersoniae]|nr:hypothetical protein HK104_005915 [Borealophlyctis nickersoniae]